MLMASFSRVGLSTIEDTNDVDNHEKYSPMKGNLNISVPAVDDELSADRVHLTRAREFEEG